MLRIVFLVAALIASASAGSVEVLDTSSFETAIASGDKYLVKFYAPWCGHCQRLAPTFDKLAEENTDATVHIAKVDCTVEKDLCGAHGIKGYPTLQLFKGGSKEGIKHSGGRDLAGLQSFIASN